MDVRGRDLIAGLPRTIPITSSEVMEAIEAPLQQLVAAVRNVLEQTPPELSSDIIDKGMVMSGGGALLRNIDKLLTQVTGVPCHVAENPLELRGAGHRPRPGALRLLQEVARPAGLTKPSHGGPGRFPAGLRRPPLPHLVQLRFAGPSARPGPGGRRPRPDPPRDHRPRPDRRRAAAPATWRPAGLTVIIGEEVKTADGDLICLFLEQRRGARAGRPSRRSPPSASRAAWSASRTHSIASGTRCSRDAGLSLAGRARRLGRDVERPDRRTGRQRAGDRVRPRPRPARGRGVGRPLDARGGRRLQHRPRRRSIDAGRAPGRACLGRADPGPGLLLRAGPDPDRQGRQSRSGQRAGSTTRPADDRQRAGRRPSSGGGPSADGGSGSPNR